MADRQTQSDSLGRPIDPGAPKLCLMGNSHIQAYRLALEQDPAPFDSVTVDLFSGNLVAWQTVRVEQEAFVTEHDALCQRWTRQAPFKDSIRPAEYDAFVLFGFGIQYMAVLRALASWDIFPRSGNRWMISRSAINAMAEGIFTSSVAHFLIRNLREMSNAPIALVLTPVPGETMLEHRGYRGLAGPDGRAVIADAIAITEQAAARVFGEDVRIVVPDPALAGESGLTPKELLRSGGAPMGDLKPSDRGYDHSHMNADYGRAMLDRLAPVFAEMLDSVTG